MKEIFCLAAVAMAVVSCAVQAGEADTMAQERKVLVVYYSRTGNTERAAKDVAAALHADLERLVDKKNRRGVWGFLGGGRDAMKQNKTEIEPLQKDPGAYGLVVLGTPVWAGNMTPAIRTYLGMNKGKMKQTAYIITAGSTRAEKIVPLCEEVAGNRPVAYAGFTATELKDDKVYREKLAKFIKVLHNTGPKK